MPKKSPIGAIASAETRKEFAEELSLHTQLTKQQIEVLFPKKADREELVRLLEIIDSSADENEKKAKLISKINEVSGAILRVVKTFFPSL